MIDVQVRAEHEIHRLGRHADPRQSVEEPGMRAAMEFRNEASILFFTDTAVEQDRASARVQHEGLDGQRQSVARYVDVVGLQQSAPELDRVRRDSWKKLGDGKLEPVDVDDDVDEVVTRLESHRVCGPT
jgi:hypothetical protein